MRDMLGPMTATFVAAVMVAAATLTVVTYLRLDHTRSQLEKQRRMTNVLVDVASAQQDLISKQQSLIGSIVDTQSAMFKTQFNMQRSLRSFAIRQGYIVR